MKKGEYLEVFINETLCVLKMVKKTPRGCNQQIRTICNTLCFCPSVIATNNHADRQRVMLEQLLRHIFCLQYQK